MPPDKRVYEFESFRIDSEERLLFRGDEPVSLTPKVADTLVLLLANAGRIVGKDELMKTIWPDAFVDEGGLARNISALRKALGEGEGIQFIETIPKRGYRFIAPLKGGAGEPTAPARKAAGASRFGRRRMAWFIAALTLVVAALAATAVVRYRNQQRFSSLIVIPLQNLSGDPAQEHVADTMTEELISTLSAIQSLRTVSFTTAMTYKTAGKTLPQIAHERNVGAAVEGAVSLSGDRVRIHVRLLDGRTEQPLWTQVYEGPLSDVSRLESEAATSIAGEIRVKLTPAERRQLSSSRPVSAEAWLDYSRGRMFWNKRTPEGFDQAIKYFQSSIARDPGYARAHSGLADAWALLGSAGGDAHPPREVMPKAREAAFRAVQLDRSLAEARTSFGYVLLSYDWDLQAARKEFERAIELNPGYATAHHWYAHYWLAAGQPQKALEEMGKAQFYDPQSLVINAGLGWCRYYAGQYRAAIEQYLETLKLAPEFALGHALLGMAYERTADYSDAEAAFQTARALQGSPTLALTGLGRVYALSGRPGDARRIAGELEHPAPARYVPAVYIAAVYAAMGDKDRAISFTRKAVEERSDYAIYLNTDPWAEPLRADPRFQEITRAVTPAGR